MTVLVTTLALDSYAASLAGQTQTEIDAAVDAFRTLLSAINMPTYGVLVDGVEPDRWRGVCRGLHRGGPDGDVQHRDS